MAAEVVGGLLTGSLALLADAGHMLTDVAGLGLALLAISFSSREPTSRHTYGFYRAEILAALANAVVLIAVSFYVLYEAYRRFIEPPAVNSTVMMLIAAVGLCVNAAGILILRAGAAESLNIKGAYFEVLSDLLTSIGVIIAAVIMMTTKWYYADPLISAGIGLFILPRTWRLLREATSILLEGTPANVDQSAVRTALLNAEGVADVHDLHVWSLTSGVNAMSVHVTITGKVTYEKVLSAVHEIASSQLHMAHVTVQVEPGGWESKESHV